MEGPAGDLLGSEVMRTTVLGPLRSADARRCRDLATYPLTWARWCDDGRAMEPDAVDDEAAVDVEPPDVDDLDPREAARLRRRDHDAEAHARDLMRPGMGKVFKQILDRQARDADERPPKKKGHHQHRLTGRRGAAPASVGACTAPSRRPPTARSSRSRRSAGSCWGCRSAASAAACWASPSCCSRWSGSALRSSRASSRSRASRPGCSSARSWAPSSTGTGGRG